MAPPNLLMLRRAREARASKHATRLPNRTPLPPIRKTLGKQIRLWDSRISRRYRAAERGVLPLSSHRFWGGFHGIPPAWPLGPESLGRVDGDDDARLEQGRADRLGRAEGGEAADRPVPRRRREPDRHGERLYARLLGGDHRRGAEGQARQGRGRDQGALQHARPAEHRRQFAHQPDRRMRAQPEAAEDRLDRPLPGASMGRRDADRGDDGGARQPRRRPEKSATSAARIFPAGTS